MASSGARAQQPALKLHRDWPVCWCHVRKCRASGVWGFKHRLWGQTAWVQGQPCSLFAVWFSLSLWKMVLLIVVYHSQVVVRLCPEGAHQVLVPEPGPWWKHHVNGSCYHNTLHLDPGSRKPSLWERGLASQKKKKMEVKVEGTTCRKARKQAQATTQAMCGRVCI